MSEIVYIFDEVLGGVRPLRASDFQAGAGGAAGTPVLDAGGASWLWVYDKETGTSTYISFATGTAGTPTFPVTPNADTTVSPDVTRGGGNIDANTQRVTLAADGPGAVALGAPADAVATTDTGTFSIISFIKRAQQNWTALQAKIPTLIGRPLTARQQSTTTASANIVLAPSVGRISLFARVSPLRYVVGSNAQTANAATSHYLAAGASIDLGLPGTPNIAVIRASDATQDGAAEITELS